MEHDLGRQTWAFVMAVAAAVIAISVALTGAFAWALAAAGIAAGAWSAARVWSRARPGPMPHFLRWVLFLPRGFQTAARLENILLPRPGERILEVGPGVGIHALPIASALAPDGVLEALEMQQEMIGDLMRRATRAGVRNIRATRGDAQRLPYPDDSFDAAYLISVLGEVPDEAVALRELHRVLKPDGRLVIGEIAVDPDFIPLAALKERSACPGFVFEEKRGPGFAYFARFLLARAVTTGAGAAGKASYESATKEPRAGGSADGVDAPEET